MNLDPIVLLKEMRDAQAGLARLSQELASSETTVILSVEEFAKQLPDLWRLGEARPTHRRKHKLPRTHRTRKDPFESVWPQVLKWLESEPDANAKELFQRLQKEHPEQFSDGQLRTLQRRVKSWRQEMAKRLLSIYSSKEVYSETKTTTIA